MEGGGELSGGGGVSAGVVQLSGEGGVQSRYVNESKKLGY